MKSTYRNLVPWFGRALFSVMAIGPTSCAVEQPASESPTEQAQETLIVPHIGTWTPWPLTSAPGKPLSYTVNVCFNNFGTKNVNDVDEYWPGWDPPDRYNDAKAQAMDILNNTWHTASALNFVSQDDCSLSSPDKTQNWLQIDLDYNSGHCVYPRSNSVGGVTATCEIGLWDPNTVWIGVAHEVGHALGMQHEVNSPANPGKICTYEQGILDAALVCVAQWDTYWAQGSSGTPPTCNYAKGKDTIRNEGPDELATVLTPYDPDSIMNYCSFDDRYARTDNAGRPDYSLTAYDKLGIEIVYPYSFTRSLVTQAAEFNVADGVVQRSDDVIMTDWSSRGADPDVFGANGIKWKVDSANSTVGATLALSSMTPGQHTVSGTFSDIFDRAQTTTQMSLKVNLNTALHTALVMTTVIL